MTQKSSKGGGALLAISILAGAIVGTALGQPSIGVLGGIALGTTIAVAIWLRDR